MYRRFARRTRVGVPLPWSLRLTELAHVQITLVRGVPQTLWQRDGAGMLTGDSSIPRKIQQKEALDANLL